MYRDFFRDPETSCNDAPVIEYHRNIPIPLDTSPDGGDAGVEQEARMDPTQLAENLGFVEGIPFLFNNHRRVDGLNSWQNAPAFVQNDENIPFLMDLDLHWHQLAAVRAIVRVCFAALPSRDRCVGVLISDEVGLGKTYQAATAIAFLADATLRQVAGVRMPPILSKQYCTYSSNPLSHYHFR